MTHPPEVYEQGNRRAEVHPTFVLFQTISGKKRRSVHGKWFVATGDIRRARRLARRWAFKAKLGKPVLH